MLLEEATQNVVQQLARVDGLQIERRFSARFQLQNTQTKEAIGAIAIDAQPTGTVNEVWAKSLVQQGKQMRVGDLAIVWSKQVTGALAFNLDAAQRRVAHEPVVTRQGQQSFDSRPRLQLAVCLRDGDDVPAGAPGQLTARWWWKHCPGPCLHSLDGSARIQS